jgi:hypothetical protein
MTKITFPLMLLVALVASIEDVTAMVTKAPKVTLSVYEEALPMMQVSQLIYSFSDVLEQAREGKIKLKANEDFPIKSLEKFADESCDLREYNDGKGVSFNEIYDFFEYNKEALKPVLTTELSNDFLSDLRNSGIGNDFYISTIRALQGNVACVYGVVKDEANKRVIVGFRGSQAPLSNMDWQTNFDARLVNLRTPKKIRNKMNGKVKDRVTVHEGFYNYLFDNKRINGEQRYDQICDDLQSLVEDDYNVYITGHSLGGALATLFSFKLAGAGAKTDWAPRPLTCITYSAPFSGSKSYRAAFEQLELDGLVRSLRVNNGEDIVPALPPFSLGKKKKTMKHTGINLRLSDEGVSFCHSSLDGISNKIKNSILKPIWNGLEWHLLPLQNERFDKATQLLTKTTIDDLYLDETVVGKRFLQGEIADYDGDEASDEEDDLNSN